MGGCFISFVVQGIKSPKGPDKRFLKCEDLLLFFVISDI